MRSPEGGDVLPEWACTDNASRCLFEGFEVPLLDPVNEWSREICWCVRAEVLRPLSDDELSSKSELLSHAAGIPFGSLIDLQADEGVAVQLADFASSVGCGDWGGELSDECASDPGEMVLAREQLHVASPTADAEICRRSRLVLVERWQVEEHVGPGLLPLGADVALWSKALDDFAVGSITVDEYERRAVLALRLPCSARFVDQVSVVNASQLGCESSGPLYSRSVRLWSSQVTSSSLDGLSVSSGEATHSRRRLRARARFALLQEVRQQRRQFRRDLAVRVKRRQKEKDKRLRLQPRRTCKSSRRRKRARNPRPGEYFDLQARILPTSTARLYNVANGCALRNIRSSRVSFCMSALKKRVAAIVMPPSTWKRTPVCCKFIAGRRFNVTRRYHRDLVELGLL